MTGGSTFGGWAANPVGSVTFADANAASTTVTIHAAGTVTATLNPAALLLKLESHNLLYQTGTAITGITHYRQRFKLAKPYDLLFNDSD